MAVQEAPVRRLDSCFDEIDTFLKLQYKKYDEIKTFDNYPYKLYIKDESEEYVIETPIPELKMTDTDGIPLSFMLSYYEGVDFVLTPWLVGQVSQTLEPLDKSHRNVKDIPYSHSGDLSCSNRDVRLEMMMFKPKHMDVIQSKIHVGAITGRSLLNNLNQLEHEVILICIPDYKKKILHIIDVSLILKRTLGGNIKHFTKYTIDPFNNVIRWTFPRDNDDDYNNGDDNDLKKFNKSCWNTNKRKKANEYYNTLIENCLRDDDSIYEFSDFALKKINDTIDKLQVIETSLPRNINSLMFAVWRTFDNFGKGLDYKLQIRRRPGDDRDIPYYRTRTIDYYTVYHLTNRESINDEERNIGIVTATPRSFATRASAILCEPTICIPDFGRGILYYLVDKIDYEENRKHHLIKYVVDYLYAHKVWWVMPNLSEFYSGRPGDDGLYNFLAEADLTTKNEPGDGGLYNFFVEADLITKNEKRKRR